MNENWKRLSVWTNNKVAETEKACLFALPSDGELKGYRFWHNKKLCHETKNPKFMSLGYTADTEFRVFKQEKASDGKYITVDEKVMNGDQIKEAFKACNKPFEKNAPSKDEPVIEEPVIEEPEIAEEDLPFVGNDDELDF